MKSQRLKLFSFFHLNMAFSSIPEERRQDVLKHCYWPLLNLAVQKNIPIGIEASGFTLEIIKSIDPSWITALRSQIEKGTCEFIGCGYAQIIGPLVPAKVNSENFRLGNQVYGELLGVRPSIALVNEQAYSAGMVDLYLEAGFKAIIMEWDNAYRSYPDWDSTWRYFPQFAISPSDRSIPVIWNKSIAFQKFQRYAHGEISLSDHVAYLTKHIGNSVRGFPLYGNDAECFDFRPGRFITEAPLDGFGEWDRITNLFEHLKQDERFELVLPSDVLALIRESSAGKRLILQSPGQPIPTKKQDKYNPLRWAVTGRDDLSINTSCWRIFSAMKDSNKVSDADWKELCYLWSSDFRTHITEARWLDFLVRLKKFAQVWSLQPYNEAKLAASSPKPQQPKIIRDGKLIRVVGSRLEVCFNCAKGLAVESFIDKEISPKSLFGTLEHGFYDEIQWGADFYSGHLVYEAPGKPKASDLHATDPQISWSGSILTISATIHSAIGDIRKTWQVIDETGCITLSTSGQIEPPVLGSLRLGHITLNPAAFDKQNLLYKTHNGGHDIEAFPISLEDINHGRPVSFLVSANQCLGITEGRFELGDSNYLVCIDVDKPKSALVGLIQASEVKDSFFFRLSLSGSELDDTCRPSGRREFNTRISIFARTN
jgi:hypothetical protein